jgi:predicted nucleotidyltransferase
MNPNNPNDPNVQQVQLVVNALGALADRVVLVGGCATGLLITDTTRPPVRATQDVDLVAEVATKTEYYALADELRTLGFQENPGEVICRWRYGALAIDIMACSDDVLGFSNRWYADAVKAAEPVTLPEGRAIRLITAPYFIATKIEAFYDRGNGDFVESRDIEDIINVVDGRPSLSAEIAATNDPVREYLKDEIDDLIATEAFVDSLPGHLRPNTLDQQRVGEVLGQLRRIAGL